MNSFFANTRHIFAKISAIRTHVSFDYQETHFCTGSQSLIIQMQSETVLQEHAAQKIQNLRFIMNLALESFTFKPTSVKCTFLNCVLFSTRSQHKRKTKDDTQPLFLQSDIMKPQDITVNYKAISVALTQASNSFMLGDTLRSKLTHPNTRHQDGLYL